MEPHDDDTPGLDRSGLITLLTTEHFTLQGARGSTISESSARAALFVGAVSSTLIALGFLGQSSDFGSEFDAFAFVVLPTLYVLGLMTYQRLVTSSMEDMLYARAINRIRGRYLELAGEDAKYFMLNGNDDVRGAVRNMAIARTSRFQLLFTLPSMIAVLDSVVGGTTLAVVLGSGLGAPVGAAVGIGGAGAAVSLVVLLRVQRAWHDRQRQDITPLYPSPAA